MTDFNHEFFKILGSILLRCWIFEFVLMFVWAGVFIVGGWFTSVGDMIFGMHGGMFGLNRHELSLVHYSSMAAAEPIVIFFFFPWLAIRLVLRKQQDLISRMLRAITRWDRFQLASRRNVYRVLGESKPCVE